MIENLMRDIRKLLMESDEKTKPESESTTTEEPEKETADTTKDTTEAEPEDTESTEETSTEEPEEPEEKPETPKFSITNAVVKFLEKITTKNDQISPEHIKYVYIVYAQGSPKEKSTKAKCIKFIVNKEDNKASLFFTLDDSPPVKTTGKSIEESIKENKTDKFKLYASKDITEYDTVSTINEEDKPLSMFSNLVEKQSDIDKQFIDELTAIEKKEGNKDSYKLYVYIAMIKDKFR